LVIAVSIVAIATAAEIAINACRRSRFGEPLGK
jgi:hypothetical protein